MRSMRLWSWLMFSVLALTASSGRAQDCPPPEDPGDPDLIQGTGNKVQFDVPSPSAFKIGEIKASGTVTAAAGWTCTKVDLEVFVGGVSKGKASHPTPGGTWGPLTITGLAPGTYTVKATGTFTKGAKSDTPPSASAVLTVK